MAQFWQQLCLLENICSITILRSLMWYHTDHTFYKCLSVVGLMYRESKSPGFCPLSINIKLRFSGSKLTTDVSKRTLVLFIYVAMEILALSRLHVIFLVFISCCYEKKLSTLQYIICHCAMMKMNC